MLAINVNIIRYKKHKKKAKYIIQVKYYVYYKKKHYANKHLKKESKNLFQPQQS